MEWFIIQDLFEKRIAAAGRQLFSQAAFTHIFLFFHEKNAGHG
jgi:hypothetical protein